MVHYLITVLHNNSLLHKQHKFLECRFSHIMKTILICNKSYSEILSDQGFSFIVHPIKGKLWHGTIVKPHLNYIGCHSPATTGLHRAIKITLCWFNQMHFVFCQSNNVFFLNSPHWLHRAITSTIWIKFQYSNIVAKIGLRRYLLLLIELWRHR